MNKKNPIVSGIGLVIFGIVFLIFQYVDVQSFIVLPIISIGFIGWGILSRNKGLIIPGGILSGVALGSILSETAWATQLEGDASNGLFMLGFAAGWFAITILIYAFFKELQWWPLIPGSIIALVGISSFTGGQALNILGSVGKLWPLILVAIGISILWKQFAESEAYEKTPS